MSFLLRKSLLQSDKHKSSNCPFDKVQTSTRFGQEALPDERKVVKTLQWSVITCNKSSAVHMQHLVAEKGTICTSTLNQSFLTQRFKVAQCSLISRPLPLS